IPTWWPSFKDCALLPAEDFPGGDQHVRLVGADEVAVAIGAHKEIGLAVLGGDLHSIEEAIDPVFLHRTVAFLANGHIRVAIHRLLGDTAQRYDREHAGEQQVFESAHDNLVPFPVIGPVHSSWGPVEKVDPAHESNAPRSGGRFVLPLPRL